MTNDTRKANMGSPSSQKYETKVGFKHSKDKLCLTKKESKTIDAYIRKYYGRLYKKGCKTPPLDFSTKLTGD